MEGKFGGGQRWWTGSNWWIRSKYKHYLCAGATVSPVRVSTETHWRTIDRLQSLECTRPSRVHCLINISCKETVKLRLKAG